jgi:hypothetical protein
MRDSIQAILIVLSICLIAGIGVVVSNSGVLTK